MVVDARFPRTGDAAAIAAIHGEQALLVNTLRSWDVARRQRIDDVGARRRNRERRAAHVRLTQHDLRVGSIGGARKAIHGGLFVRPARCEQHVFGSIGPQREIEAAAAHVDRQQPRPRRAVVGRSPHARPRRGIDAS